MDRARVQRMAQCALLGALALVFSYLETMIPIPLGVPGIKLGLANAAVLVALMLVDTRAAAGVATVKVLASGFLFGSPTMLAYSAAGTLLALAAMVLLAKPCGLGVVPVSMASAICHNIGQLVVASMMLSSAAVFMTLPVLAAAACVTGMLVGVATQAVCDALRAGEAVPRREVDISQLRFAPGEHVAFVGVNGSGKSTAALQLAGLLGDASHTACLVMQDPASQLVKSQAEDDVAFGPENLGVVLEQMRELVAGALADAGAASFADSDVNELSGGQMQQVAIAGVLAMTPQMIVFDESTSMLDAAGRERFAALVRELCAQGTTVVTVTQIPSEVLTANRALLFADGAVAFEGDPAEALECMRRLSEAGEAQLEDDVQTTLPFAGDAADGRGGAPAVLSCEDVFFAYPGSKTSVLQGVSLRVAAGEVVGLKGPCGSGKSTLAQVLAGTLVPCSGQVRLGDVAAEDDPATREFFRRSVAYVEQHPERALFAKTAFDDVLFGARNLGLDDDDARARAEAALAAVGLDVQQAKEKSPFAYSGGEQRRIALAGILVLDTPFLLLDEPAAGLDPLEVVRLQQLVAALAASGKGIVLIAHDDELLSQCCARVAELSPVQAVDCAHDDAPHVEARPLPVSFGRYRAGDAPMHCLDARVKIVLCLLYMLAGFAAQGWLALLAAAVFGVGLLAAAKTTARQAWASLRPFAPLMVFVGLFDAFFTGNQDIWWQAGPLSFGAQSVAFAAESVIRFAMVAVATSTLMATTNAIQLSDGSAALLAPLRRFGMRVDDMALSLSMTLRFLPLVQEELACIKRAQEARFASFESGSLLQRVKSFVPVIVPLFAGCLRRSQDLALAIQNRAYGAAANRTCYREHAISRCDIVAIALVAVLFVAVIALRVVF